MPFLWFWTFWHWSRESFRDGALLRGPLHGIGSHWDEWYRHEASEEERAAIEAAGHSETSQQAFIDWLSRQWAAEADATRNRLVPGFVLGQLAVQPPFDRWPALTAHRETYGARGIHAIVLAEESRGERADVRVIEAVTLPAEAAATPGVIPEGFQADPADLDAPRDAALNLLVGKARWSVLVRWIAYGRRFYPRWLGVTLTLGWIAVAGLIGWLLVAPDPGGQLASWFAGLLLLWAGLVVVALGTIARQAQLIWRDGRVWAARLSGGQVRLRMNGGLMLKGGSAGLAYCFNLLLSVFRAYPEAAGRAWVWRSFFHRLKREAPTWAATGIVTAAGTVKPVMLSAKLRACHQRADIRHLLAPRQPEAKHRSLERRADVATSVVGEAIVSGGPMGIAAPTGFAAEPVALRVHRCGTLAHALMIVGGCVNRWQAVTNLFAVLVSVAMLAALPDFHAVLRPPLPPMAVPPASPSPYYLWVSLDTRSSDYFQVVLESRFWTNRRVDVQPQPGPHASVRAEIRLQRAAATSPSIRPNEINGEDGTVWIERRRRFLWREYHPGERVGRYSFSYLARLGHE